MALGFPNTLLSFSFFRQNIHRTTLQTPNKQKKLPPGLFYEKICHTKLPVFHYESKFVWEVPRILVKKGKKRGKNKKYVASKKIGFCLKMKPEIL
jgi:hypothetical protein